MKSGTRLIITQPGPPADALRLENFPIPSPGPEEILVRMELAPINPADLNFIEGTYGIKPVPPTVPGNEGTGIIEAVGAAVTRLIPGDRVAVSGPGTWTSHYLTSADRCHLVPREVAPHFAAMLWVNPPTAWCLLHTFLNLQAGEWIMQNASTSAVGRCVIQIARARGWKTFNLVRRPEVMDELRALGADAVVLEEPALPKQLPGLIGTTSIRLGLNAVGGESAALLAKCLGPDAHLITYGAMARQPLKIANGLLIFKNLTCHGFWMTRHYRTMTPADQQTMFESLINLHQRGQLTIPVDSVQPLSQWPNAIQRASASTRPGKVLLDLQN